RFVLTIHDTCHIQCGCCQAHRVLACRDLALFGLFQDVKSLAFCSFGQTSLACDPCDTFHRVHDRHLQVKLTDEQPVAPRDILFLNVACVCNVLKSPWCFCVATCSVQRRRNKCRNRSSAH